jgi:uncharacterized circularly permuted ATP-grasp superfamily protein/uncharacterized alpha-E superfamily protein
MSLSVLPVSPRATEGAPLSEALRAAARQVGVYDEVFTSEGITRPNYEILLQLLDKSGAAELRRLRAVVRRRINEQEVTFNILGTPDGTDRPWLLDPLPVVYSTQEWTTLCKGMAQRARLLSMVYEDIYGAQRLLRAGIIPAELVFTHPDFARSCVGWVPRGGTHLRLYAMDLGRAPNGQHYAYSDRTAAPAGSGYSLENRLVLGRTLTSAFNACGVERVRDFFETVRETVRQASPEGVTEPRTVLLTPGARDESSFEHAYLARYLGYELVEGRDLTVRDRVVYMKTLGGLQRVHVILRRIYDRWCDPLALREDSFIGVPGLVDAAMAGNVGIVNPLGAAVTEAPALKQYFPAAAKYLLGEELLIPSVETLWCGDPKNLARVLASPDPYVIKPAYEDRQGAVQEVGLMSGELREQTLERLKANPGRFVAERWPERSIVPLLEADNATYGDLSLRTFLARKGDDYHTMPGGLARINGSPDGIFLGLTSEQASKDVWVMSGAAPVTLVPPAMPDRRVNLRRGGLDLPSRLLDDLYWLGRNVERADMAARLLRAAFDRLGSEGGRGRETDLAAVLVALQKLEVIPKLGGKLDAASVTEALFDGLLSESNANSLVSVFGSIRLLTLGVRSRLSRDAWYVLRRGPISFKNFSAGDRTPAAAADLLSEVLTNLAATSGTILENMVRGHAWLFLDMGRRVERGNQILAAVSAMLPKGADRSHMEGLLEVADSLLTYRARYLSSLQVGPVVDLILTDETNPRSLVFQVNALRDHVERLPRLDGAVRSKAERRIIELQSGLMTVDVLAACAAQGAGLRHLIEDASVQLWQFSDEVSHTWFSHATSSRALVAPGWIDEELEAR